ncbi:hypothetical protein J3Q64DRAFT_1710236 [Phycomyces blakesleeanus]|uniref:Uncharacterized protein n=2 Tax=Phycomyces blakesleeanus TaxID=4837 RepID=A0A167K697_PHYB8|nr:hypothetical protein PHYBLDRAFT_183628 [Phycomyces blakesleeanus NRRL 1555(-)]OAD67359.1 hypothetical protein PHYBLDRAFT_183628 [Phycomyces blakesleeanus NRRL 1555(-)]|eukprot:XP_018285399.1 hypothetical protein PHYBLDRAFT_183628 [Phycomyces blakesleeanus NRRL 1555(-)]
MASNNSTIVNETKSIDTVPIVNNIDSTLHSAEISSLKTDLNPKMAPIPNSDPPTGLDGERDSKKQCTDVASNTPESVGVPEVNKNTVVDDHLALLAQIEQLKQELAAALEREKAETVKREKIQEEHETDQAIQIKNMTNIIENNNTLSNDIKNEKTKVHAQKETIEGLESTVKSQKQKIDDLESIVANHERDIHELKKQIDYSDHRQKELENNMQEFEYEYKKLDSKNADLKHVLDTCKADLEAKRASYKSMEANFYSYLRSIRATDDDHSTIQTEVKQICSKLNNLTMSLRGHADIVGGTSFVLKHWPEREAEIRELLMTDETTKEKKDTLDLGFIALFFEKYIVDVFTSRIFNQPVHIGVSINETYKQLDEWMVERNEDWAGRLRQQMCALVNKHPGKEQANIEGAKNDVVTEIMVQMKLVYPNADMDNTQKKIAMLVGRATKVSMAMNSQEVRVRVGKFDDGKTEYDEDKMLAVNKGKAGGTVFLTIIPPFVALDGCKDNVLVAGKVLCL